MRLLPTGVPALAIAVLVAGNARAHECKDVDSSLVSALFIEGCQSPVGFCTRGTVAKGPLAGTFEFTALTSTPASPDSPVLFYTGVVVYSTKKGIVHVTDAGMFNGGNGAFMEVQRVKRGTRAFKNARGTLSSQGDGIFIDVNGTPTLVGFNGSVGGEICTRGRDREDRDGDGHGDSDDRED